MFDCILVQKSAPLRDQRVIKKSDWSGVLNSDHKGKFWKKPLGEFVEIQIRPLLTKMDAKFSFSAIEIKISTAKMSTYFSKSSKLT